MFMQIAIGAIGIGIVLMVGYLIVGQVRSALPTPQRAYSNTCYGIETNATFLEADTTFCNTSSVACGPHVDNSSLTVTCDDAGFVSGISGSQTTVFAGFALVAVGIIVLAAFGLVKVFA